MVTQDNLRKLYADFWLQYSESLPRAVSYFPERTSPFAVSQERGKFTVGLAVDFNRLRYKTSTGARNIALRIRGTKHFVFDRHDQSAVVGSNVLMNYFLLERVESKDTLRLVQALHYDYEIDEKSLVNHPIYHCQTCNDLLGGEFFGRNDYVILGQKDKVYQHFRIPTANMDMISVLLSIAADHSSAEEFKKVLQVFDKGDWNSKLPHLAHNEAFSPTTCYRSRDWYTR